MERIKILEVIRQGQIGGGESHLADLVELMDKTRYEPLCLSFTPGEMITRLESQGIKCHVINSTHGFDIAVQQKVFRLIKDERVTLVHAHGTRAASNVLFPAWRARVPMVYTVHGWSFHDDQGRLSFNVRRWSEKLICHCARRVICVSEGNAATGEAVFGLKPPVVIKNGVNLNRFNPGRTTKLSRKDFGLADSDFVAGFIARCTKQKAPLDYLAAVELAHAADSRVKGLFVGEGDMDGDVDRYISGHKMEGYVCRSPFRTDIPDVLMLMDTYCLPSLWEGLSIGMLEAMATGRVIIATPTDGAREVIDDGQNGIIVPFDSPQSTADAILRLIGDKSLRNRCSDNAASLIASRFNAQHTADAVVRVYDNIVSGLSTPIV